MNNGRPLKGAGCKCVSDMIKFVFQKDHSDFIMEQIGVGPRVEEESIGRLLQ